MVTPLRSGGVVMWCVLAVLTLLASPAAMAQRNIYVRQTGSDSNNGLTPQTALRNLSTALTNSQNSDTIIIGAGTWTAANDIPNRSNLTIQGDPTGRFTGDAGTTILTSNAGVTINFSDSSTGTYTLRDLTLRQSSNGTPLSIGGSTNGPSSVTAERLTIDQGTRSLLVTRGTIVLSDSDLTAGSAAAQAVRINGPTNSNTTIRSSRINGTGMASAVHIVDANATVLIDRSTIIGGGYGLLVNNGNVTVVNTVVRDTTSDGLTAAGGTVSVVNCTLWAGNNGITAAGGNVTVRNTIVSSFTTGLRTTGGNLNAFFCLLNGNTTATSNTGGSLNTTSTVTGAPNFISTASGDFRLNSGSAAINAGQDVAGVPSVDWYNRPRDWQRDIGAFERYSQSPVAVPYTQTFDAGTPGEWSASGRVVNNATLGTFSGVFSTAGSGIAGNMQTLALTVTPGTEYLLRFDLLALQSWDGERFEVHVNGRRAFSEQFWCACNSGYISSYGPSYTTYGPSPSLPPSNYMNQSWTDQAYRGVWVRFTPTQSPAIVVFSAPTLNEGGWPDEGWGIDNVSVATLTTPAAPYSSDFTSVPGPEWSTQSSTYTATTGNMAGRYGRLSYNSTEQTNSTLTLNVVNGTTYYVSFDLATFDSWDGDNTTWGPDFLRVFVDDVQRFASTFTSWGGGQSYPINPDIFGSDLGFASWNNDVLYRRIWLTFTATSTTARIRWTSQLDGDFFDESYAIDNVVVRPAGDTNLFNSQSPGGSLVNSMPRFVDITATSGYPNSRGGGAFNSTGGLYVADLDKNGRMDILVAGETNGYALLSGTATAPARFTEQFLGGSNAFQRGVLLDYDRDGVLDFYGGGQWVQPVFRRGAITTGTLGFTSAGDGGVTITINPMSFAAFDRNADGMTDVLILDGNDTRYAADNASSSATPVFNAQSGPMDNVWPNNGGASNPAVADVNRDGLFDIYFQRGNGQLLVQQSSGTFTTVSRGIVNSQDPQMSVWVDYNNDGWPDLFSTTRSTTGRAKLWRNPGATGNFVDVNDSVAAAAAGLPFAAINGPAPMLGAAWGDYDNDGDLDLYTTSAENSRLAVLWRNEGNGTFLQASEGVSALGDANDATFVDYDNDGDLDIVTSGSWGGHRVFENLTSISPQANNYFKVQVVYPNSSNTAFMDDLRATVELWDSTNTTFIQQRRIGVQRGTAAEPFIAHFGGVNPALTYTVRVYTAGLPGNLFTTTLVPTANQVTVGANTSPQTARIVLPALGLRRIRNWVQVDPNAP